MDREDTIEALKKECERLRITRLEARRRAKRLKHAWQTEKSKVRSAEYQARMQKDLLDKICESVGGAGTAAIRINRLQKTQDRLFHENEALQAECEKLRKDSDRLDWLADPNNHIGNVELPKDAVLRNPHSLRGAIDDAMEGGQA